IAGSPRTETTWRQIAAPAAAALAVVFVGYAVPTSTTAPAGEQITIAVVQGNVPRMGLDFNEQRRAVLDNHVSATIELAADVDAGRRPQPDVVVWPENASDIDPQLNPDAADEIDSAARAIGVPIVLGTILHDDAAVDGPRAKNASLVWDPETGSGFEYVKQHPVPFAEYIPMEQFVRTVAGWIDERIVKDGLDRVNGFAPGDEPGVIPVGDVTLSGIICFEIAYDGQVRESVTEGAQILAVQTNNATFNEAEALQQMAMVQIRSIEHARPGLMASTVGVSGFVDETGEVSQATGFNEPAVIVSTFNLGEGTTPATTLGALPELLGSAAAVAVLVLAATRRRRRKSADAKG
ncbi:MAG: apolipoprotein N-acyltransferase, partial [Stackebrandtia sp.]